MGEAAGSWELQAAKPINAARITVAAAQRARRNGRMEQARPFIQSLHTAAVFSPTCCPLRTRDWRTKFFNAESTGVIRMARQPPYFRRCTRAPWTETGLASPFGPPWSSGSSRRNAHRTGRPSWSAPSGCRVRRLSGLRCLRPATVSGHR